jgi:cytochrome c-type biogenesis protein CcmH
VIRRLLLVLALLLPGAALAVSNPAEMLPDPALEHRARELGREIRCMVCQNQSIEDSEATLARDLRLVVREQIASGASDDQVRQFLHARYGDFVLLRPPFNPYTAVLWATPALALGIGLFFIVATRRRSAAIAAPAPLTEEERQRLARLEAEDRTP